MYKGYSAFFYKIYIYNFPLHRQAPKYYFQIEFKHIKSNILNLYAIIHSMKKLYKGLIF